MKRIWIALIGVFVAAIAFSIGPATAQDRVDCGNGFHCPAGNACLLDGGCGLLIDMPPGSVESRTQKGFYCEPGFRESTVRPGNCIPGSYLECPNGFTCPPGAQCAEGGGCTGGPPATGPVCGTSSVRCAEGRICSSRNTCLNTQYFHDCGNGTICTKGGSCEYPSGCAFVAKERTRQIPNR